MEPTSDTVVRLKDGRGIGVAEFGEPSGFPVFYLHGFPSCRLEPAISHEPAAAQDVRLIALDRPGIGRSDPAPRANVARTVNDVVACADALGIDRFAVLGGSGGGPYALACARKFPERLTAVGVVSGFGRIGAPGTREGMRWGNRLAFSTARTIPYIAHAAMWTMGRSVRNDPDKAVRQMAQAMGGRDTERLLEPDTFGALRTTVVEAFRAGNQGQVDDMRRLVGHWGFRLGNIPMPVYLWHGLDDRLVPESMARDIVDLVPDCRAEFVPGEGHLLALTHVDEILRSLRPA